MLNLRLLGDTADTNITSNYNIINNMESVLLFIVFGSIRSAETKDIRYVLLYLYFTAVITKDSYYDIVIAIA